MYKKRNIIHEIFVPKSVITWIFNHIRCPITGYEHKTKSSGKYMNKREQLSETHYQLMVIASDYFRRGASENKILGILSNFKKENN